MAAKPETTFYTAINRLLPRELHKEKMNNPYRGGTADMWYSGNRGDLWVEYKWLAHHPRGEFKPDLSALQIQWLSARHKEGRNVAVIIGCTKGVMILRHPDWNYPVKPNFTLSRHEAAAWIVKETYAAEDENISDSS